MKHYLTIIILAFMFYGASVANASDNYGGILDKIQSAIDKSDWDSSERLIKEALKAEPANPNNFLLFSNLGTIERNLGKLDEALTNYDLALSIAPNSSTILHNRASLLIEMDSVKRALKDYEKLVELDDKDCVAHNFIGMIALEFGNFDLAKESFQKVLKVESGNMDSKRGLALLYKLNSQYNDAILLYNEIIKKENKQSNYLNRAECYIAKSEFTKAQQDLSEAQKLDPKSSDLYLLKASLAFSQFRYDDANNYAKEAIQLGADESLVQKYIVKKEK